MKNYSKAILNELLDKYERSSIYKGDNSRDIKISFKFTADTIGDYFNEYNPELKKEINEQCRSLQDRSYIDIQWKKFQEGNIIEKVTLNIDKIDNIYNEIKRPQKRNLEEQAIEILSQYIGYENWLGKFASEMKSKLEKKASVKKHFDIEDCKSIEEIMYALKNIIDQDVEIPRRVFSVKVFNDSKKIERLESKLVRIMVDFGGYNGDVDVLAEANIVKNPGYVYVKGPAVLKCNNEIIDLDKLNGEIGLSTSLIDNLEVVSVNACRVVSIENLTSFHSYIAKNDFVVYLGGYHNEIRRKFLKKIYRASEDVPFFHWGDIDLGGFRILNHLKKKTGIPFKPLFMDKDTLIKYKDYFRNIEDEKYLENLKNLLEDEDYKEFYEVIEYMVEDKVKLEQESMALI